MNLHSSQYAVLPADPPAPPEFSSEIQPWGWVSFLLVTGFMVAVSAAEGAGVGAGGPLLLVETSAVFLGYVIYVSRRDADLERQRVEWMRRQIESAERRASDLTDHATRCLHELHDGIRVLPSLLVGAEAFLIKAGVEFAERAYEPFWDMIEQGTVRLAMFNSNLLQVRRALEEYRVALTGEVHNFPAVVVNSSDLPDPSQQSQRLRRLVRAAQKDYEFTIVSQNRKTHRVLTAGFRNLSEAIEGVENSDAFSGVSDLISRVSARQIEEQVELRKSFEAAAERWEQNRRQYLT